ncbi:O-antigen ligase family protein [Aeromonas salmonicida]|uniref:O-antigen ligase family protein n=1 Tax=Aeromonas salmonicida TaxID=645 RepID=UPI003CF502E6
MKINYLSLGKIDSYVVSLLMLSFFMFQFMYVKDGNILFQFLNMFIGMVSFIYVYRYVHLHAFLYLMVMVCFSTFTTIISAKYKVGDIAFSLLMPMFGFLMVLYRDRLVIPALIFCVGVIAYCGRAIFLGLDLNTELFSFSSRNYISVLAMFSFFTVYISCKSEKIKTILLILTFLIILFSDSRSAVLSFIVVVLAWIYHLWMRNVIVGFVLVLIAIVTASYFLFYYGNDIYNSALDTLGILRRLSAGGLADSGRFNVIQCYYSEFGLDSFLLGLDAFDGNVCRFLANGSDNPHNSFIKMYANLGLFSFAVFIVIFLSVLSFFKRKDIIMFSFLLCFLIRSGTDIIFFFQSWDAYLFAIFVIAMPKFFLNESGVMKISDYNSRG